MRFDWHQNLFERYEGSYRRFLSNWGGGTNVVSLREATRQLKNEALLPVSLRESIAAAEQIFTASGAGSEDAKRAAADLKEQFDLFVAAPWAESKRP